MCSLRNNTLDVVDFLNSKYNITVPLTYHITKTPCKTTAAVTRPNTLSNEEVQANAPLSASRAMSHKRLCVSPHHLNLTKNY